jgi:DNA-binding beta-propeller fold protein YncE
MKMQSFPELEWINTKEPLAVDKLKGNVILINFFTYCCINCLHAQSEIRYLEEKFKDEPFIVIGVHCAKFANEKDRDNILKAVQRLEINHPVVIDNDFQIWKQYGVRVWPTFLLVGSDGDIVGMASGEGNLEVVEQSIEKALALGRENGTLAAERTNIELLYQEESFLKYPRKLFINKDKKMMYVSDMGNNRILEIEINSFNKGKLKNIIGSGVKGFKDGTFAEAMLNKPNGIFLDGHDLYICDSENHSIRLADIEKGTIQTIVGDGTKARWGDARGETLNSPWDIYKNGETIFIAMAGSHQIWRMDTGTYKLRPFIGNGRENLVDGNSRKSQLAQPSGLASDGRDLFFADAESSAIRKVNMNSGLVKTIAGKGLFIYGYRDGKVEDALFQHPRGVYFENGILYVADTFNNSIRIINMSKKTVQTLISSKDPRLCSIDESSKAGQINEPNDVVRFGGYLYITDTNNNLVRVLDIKKRTIYDFEIER